MKKVSKLLIKRKLKMEIEGDQLEPNIPKQPVLSQEAQLRRYAIEQALDWPTEQECIRYGVYQDKKDKDGKYISKTVLKVRMRNGKGYWLFNNSRTIRISVTQCYDEGMASTIFTDCTKLGQD